MGDEIEIKTAPRMPLHWVGRGNESVFEETYVDISMGLWSSNGLQEKLLSMFND